LIYFIPGIKGWKFCWWKAEHTCGVVHIPKSNSKRLFGYPAVHI